MALGVIELREVRDGNRTVKKPFISGTDLEMTQSSLRQSGWGALSFSDIGEDLDIEYDVKGNKPTDVRRYAAIPAGVRRILESQGCNHPGLALDKFIYRSADQSFAKHALQKVVEVNNARNADADWFRELRERCLKMVNQDGRPHTLLRGTTTGPLTLYLARASALEHAGICLHPLYGFAYLPGSGLKGMARAYAETVWLPAQPNQKQAWKQIEDIFGWAPNPDRRQQINDPNHPAEVRRKTDSDPNSPEIRASSGNIVFHDAWPTSWPQLIVDIVNNHHPDYYQAEPDDSDHPPGDWEGPVPVYFLAVKPDTTFTFPLSKRRADVPADLLASARDWLLGALCHLGAGAKTVAGYGAFKPVSEEVPALPSQKRAIFGTTLELVTPAFLAGASQQKEDCDLRPATLRGLLRWWWRTLHAGFVDLATLRRIEASVWGDTKSGGAVRVTVQAAEDNAAPVPCPFKRITRNKADKEVLRFDDRNFGEEHGIELAQNNRTQGIIYSAYGMDEMDAGKLESRRRRWYAPFGNRWTVTMTARDSEYIERDGEGKILRQHHLPALLILEQGKLALWWLCRLGSVGSKGRKGYGSFADFDFPDFEAGRWRTHGKAFRRACGLAEDDFNSRKVASPSLRQMRDLVGTAGLGNWLEVQTRWTDPWRVLDEIGNAMQEFAQAPPSTHHGKHCPAKRHLGMPRAIHRKPNQEELFGVHGNRHPAPVLYHVAKGDSGLIIRVAAFPTADTAAPDSPHDAGWQESCYLLEDLLRHLQSCLTKRVSANP